MAINNQSIFTRLFVNDFPSSTTTLAVFLVPGVPSVDKLVPIERITVTLIRDPLHKVVGDTLTATEVFAPAKTKPNNTAIRIGETIGVAASRLRGIAEVLSCIESFSYTLNGSAPTPSFTQIPTLTLSSDSVASLILRAPIFGDTEKLQFTRVGRNTRGGDLKIYQDSMWPTTDVFHFEFEYLTKLQADALLVFFKATLGKTITVVDHNSRTWHGYILTPEELIIQPAVHGFTVKFDFQNKIDT